MTINADSFTPADAGNIPTGEIRSVEGTALDFRTPTVIGDGMASEYREPDASRGYDNNWVLNKTAPGELSLAAEVYEPSTGIVMTVSTTEPGIQIYTCNSASPRDIGKYGEPRSRHSSIALETQHYPDSPNHPEFPSTVLRPGETFTSRTVYAFSTR
jgi:aldose 1-epimerase